MTNKLYFLGAGFSKSLFPEMPLMNQLSNELISEFNDEIQKLNVFNFNDNFEEMISYLYSNYPWKSEPDRFEMFGLYTRFMDYLYNRFSELEKLFYESVIIPEKLDDLWNRFFVDITKNSRTIVTLNYDTLVESIIFNYKLTINPSGTLMKYNACANIQSYLDFYKLPLANIASRIGEGSVWGGGAFNRENIHIIKLHGSMNWFHSRDINNPGDALFYMINYFNNRNAFIHHTAGLKPFIIPPSLDKSSFYFENRFMRIPWEQARTALANSNELVFFGYSLPLSDSYMRLLFKSTLKSSLDRIIIVNIDNSSEFQNHINRYFNFLKCNIIFYHSLEDYLNGENIIAVDCA